MIEASNVTKSFNNKIVLDRVSFTLEKGEIMAIMGENGAGKSTLLSILATLSKPTSGDVLFEGESIVKQPRIGRENIGYIPQEISLHMNLSLKENLDFWAAMNGLNRQEAKVANAGIVSLLKLEPHLKTKVSKLSGGFKRRLNIGVSLYRSPKVLIMDEPTVGIDIAARKDILDFVLDMKRNGVSIFYVTHIEDETHRLADKVLYLHNGSTSFYGSADDFLSTSST